MDTPTTSLTVRDDPLKEFAYLFEHAPVALILVDMDRQVLCINRDAAQLAGQVPKKMVGSITGVALGCPNVDRHPLGCGHSPDCHACGFKRLIERTFETRQRQEQIEILATFGTTKGEDARRLRVSACLVTMGGEDRTLLAIDEVHTRSLPPGSAPALEAPA